MNFLEVIMGVLSIAAGIGLLVAFNNLDRHNMKSALSYKFVSAGVLLIIIGIALIMGIYKV